MGDSRNEKLLRAIIDNTEYTEPPQSRNEAILKSIIDGTEYTEPPQSPIEELLIELKAKIEEGGGGFDTGSWLDVFQYSKHLIATTYPRANISMSIISSRIFPTTGNTLWDYFKSFNNADVFIDIIDYEALPVSDGRLYVIGYSDDKTTAVGRSLAFASNGYVPAYEGTAEGSGSYADVVQTLKTGAWSPAHPDIFDKPSRTFTGIANN